MIRSMTGFGRAERSAGGWRCVVEMRTVNGRHLDVRLRLPTGLADMEEPLRKRVSLHCERGKLDGQVSLIPERIELSLPRLNRPLLEGYGGLLREAAAVLGAPLSVSLGDLLGLRDVFETPDWNQRDEAQRELLTATVQEALEHLLRMRETEGAALREVLLANVGTIEALVEEIVPLTRDVPERYAQRLRDNVARLSQGVVVPEERILQEITLFADRCDVSEEFARLGAHLNQLRAMLDAGGAVGRKFDFLLQELNREANTLGVKSNDSTVSNLIVSIKVEIEKLREQIQNVE